MTRNPAGKVGRKRIFAAADEVRRARRGLAAVMKYSMKFMDMGAEAGSFLKKAF